MATRKFGSLGGYKKGSLNQIRFTKANNRNVKASAKRASVRAARALSGSPMRAKADHARSYKAFKTAHAFGQRNNPSRNGLAKSNPYLNGMKSLSQQPKMKNAGKRGGRRSTQKRSANGRFA